MLAAQLPSVVAALAAATTWALRVRRWCSLIRLLFLPVLEVWLLFFLGSSPAAAGSSGGETREERAISLDAAAPGNTEELRSLWQKCQQENAAVATVRTNIDDFIGFAACSELNLELDDVWVDVPDGRAQLGYKWLLYPKEAVGTDLHLRRAVSRSEARLLKVSQLLQKATLEAAEAGMPIPFGATDGSIAIQYNSHLNTAKVTDAASFTFSVTQGSNVVLGRLLYKSIVIHDKRIVTYPEISVGTDSELCGLVLLRTLLKRAQAFGLVEVRIRVESSNIALLKAASCTGFRPVSISIHQSRAHHVFIANPQLPLPAVSELKQKIATLDRMSRHLTVSYFQAQALRTQQQETSSLGEEHSAGEVETVVDGPYQRGGLREPQESVAVDLEKLCAPALLTGFGAILLAVFAGFMWRRRKSAAAVSLGPRRLPLHMRAGGPANVHLRYQDDRYLSPPPHWRDRQQIESIHESLSSEESDDWKATGQLDA
ncbi:hypothetical protein Emag_005409 [Eimeria magna]